MIIKNETCVTESIYHTCKWPTTQEEVRTYFALVHCQNRLNARTRMPWLFQKADRNNRIDRHDISWNPKPPLAGRVQTVTSARFDVDSGWRILGAVDCWTIRLANAPHTVTSKTTNSRRPTAVFTDTRWSSQVRGKKLCSIKSPADQLRHRVFYWVDSGTEGTRDDPLKNTVLQSTCIAAIRNGRREWIAIMFYWWANLIFK